MTVSTFYLNWGLLLNIFLAFTLLSIASGLQAMKHNSRFTSIRKGDFKLSMSIDDRADSTNNNFQDSSSNSRRMSWPFDNFDAAPMLTGELAADCGFDPWRIAKSKKELFALREAEVKHARLAMLGNKYDSVLREKYYFHL